MAATVAEGSPDVTWIPKNTTTDWIYDKVLKAMVEANDNMFHFELTTLKDKIQLGCYRGDQKGKYGRHVDMGSDDIHACRKLSISILFIRTRFLRRRRLDFTNNHSATRTR